MGTTTVRSYELEQMVGLYCYFDQHEQLERKEKMVDFYQKKEKQMQHICFCGHFSAGKSTILNHLLDEALLPQSPIPTSANIVEIKRGEDAYIIHFTEQKPVRLDSSISLSELHALCRDGEEICKVEIIKNNTDLPPQVTLMDTPGIDAADDADRILTESALHVVDFLYYVMDYNHVQSEVNASFLKHLEALNKPYAVIINQMDKHKEEEISFDDFKSSLEKVFQQWGIQPTDVFFTSLKEEQAWTDNQWSSLQTNIQQKMVQPCQELVDQTSYHGINHIIQESIAEKQEEMDQKLTELEDELGAIEIQDDRSEQELQSKKADLITAKNDVESTYRKMVEQTLKNAPLMPFELRELAKDMLQAYEPTFKIGLFKSKQKTELERTRRLEAFYQALQKQVETTLEWKLRDKVTEFLLPYTSTALNESIFDKQFSQEQLVEQMNDNVRTTGEYVLVYTDKLANQLKKLYRQYYKDKWHEKSNEIFREFNEKIDQLDKRIKVLEQSQKIKQEIQAEKLAFMHYKNELEEHLSSDFRIDQRQIEAFQRTLTEREQIKTLMKKEWNFQDTEDGHINENVPPLKKNARYQMESTLEDVEWLVEHTKEIDSLKPFIKEIMEKRERLENRHFTIALFGAFSAGKSSFANALMGERVLPVSPNPTTAAINKISPPNEEFQHKEVYVHLKSEGELIADITSILGEVAFQNLDEVEKWIHKHKIDKLQIEDQHKTFLHAFYTGLPNLKNKIGSSFKIHFDQFANYVREEQISCFVKEMELYYDCPLTRQHITLVDTPGADSVNARHTELAFSYIKNADAILFVTYYNHPFSRPDKAFLEKLGSVKDAFQLDKMFFIVNAMDLAKDQTEVNLVTDYVKTQLKSFDIHHPRMYPVSSQQALQLKKEGQTTTPSGMKAFESSFYSFITEELTQLSMQSIYTDISRIHALVTKWLELSHSDQTKREAFLAKNENNQAQMHHIIEQRNTSTYFQSIEQKLEKQCFYVMQRFMIQFIDMFRDFISPGSIQSNGRKGKEELVIAIKELNKQINERMKYELEAILIRINAFWNVEWKQWRNEINRQLQKVDSSFSLSELEEMSVEEANLFQKIDLEDKTVQGFAHIFKDTKTFFAQNDRDKLEEELKQVFSKQWQEEFSRIQSALKDHYAQLWIKEDQQVWANYSNEVSTYFENVKKGLTDNFENIELLEKLNQELMNRTNG